MAQPDVGDVHVDALLTDVSIGYKPGGFIADSIFPIVGVDKQSDVYVTYDRSFWARDEGRPNAALESNPLLRAPGTQAAVAGYQVNKDAQYFAINEAVGVEIPDELVANADAVFNLEQDATLLATTLLKIRRDRAFVVDFMKTGVWGDDQTISNKWSDFGAGTPIEDLRESMFTVRQNALAMPGTICITMGALVWRRLSDHPDLLDRIKYTEKGITSPDLLASLLSTPTYNVQVKIGEAVYTADEEGTAESSVTLSDIWDDDVLITFRPESASRMVPSSGYTFVWTPLVGGGLAMEFIRRIREERSRKTIVEAHIYYDQVATLTKTGVYIDDAVD